MKLPKNIRQIGEVEEGKKVYVEDYVMTYVKQLAEKEGDYQAAVLLGQAEWHNNSRHIFINGAVEIRDFRMESDTVFSNEIWSDVYDKIKTYFEEVEVIGWLFAKPGQEFRIDDRLRKIHLDNFSGQDKVFMIYDAMEKEESFFIFTGNHFKRLKGYYIYYEKNEGMQNFMIERNQSKTSENEVEEQAIKDMRVKMSNRKEEQTTRKFSQYIYGMGTVVAAVVLIVGTSMLNSQSKMKNMEDALNVISDNLSSPEAKEGDDDSKVTVETLDGNLDRDVEDGEGKGGEEWVEASQSPQEGESAETQVGQTNEILNEGGVQTPVENQNQNQDQEESQAEGQAVVQSVETPAPADSQNTPSDKKESGDKKPKKKKDINDNKVNQETNVQAYDVYIVKKGDTLSQIAERVFRSIHYVEAIKSLNNLNDENYIYEGQELMLPVQ